jgi:hypothetical protein
MSLNIIGWILIFTGVTIIIGTYTIYLITYYTRTIAMDNEYYKEQQQLRADARKLPTLLSGQ